MNQIVAVLSLTLEDFSNIGLAVLNNGLTGFGSINSDCIAYQKAVSSRIVKESGLPAFNLEDILLAISHNINKRISEGSWK